MDFEVTATRKRPVTLDEMVGQDFVVATLRNALENNQIAPAYLFSGPRGVGKTSAARILARSLNCTQGPTPNPCGSCGSCVEIAKGSSPDVIEIDGASNTGVNDVREIREEVLYAPQGSRKKIYIIDEVHMLSNSAFNALLKTIEEPPPYIVFVFATTELHKVPATIRSRCQQFRFRLIPLEVIREKVVEAARESGKTIEDEASLWIAREGTGSLRDAYTLLDQIASFSGEKISMVEIRDKLGLVGSDRLTALVSAAADGNRQKALDALGEIFASGVAAEQILVELSGIFRTLTLLSYGVTKETLLGALPESFPDAPRKVWGISRLEEATEEILNLYREIRYSLDSRYEVELLVGKLCSLKERLDAGDVYERIKALRGELVTGNWDGPRDEEEKKKKIEILVRPEPPPERPPVSRPEPTPAASSPPETLKDRLVNRLKKDNLTVASALEKARGWQWENDTVTLVFASSYEAAVVKKETDLIKETGRHEGFDPFRLVVKTGDMEPTSEESSVSNRTVLVKQVFRGQIIGKS